MSYENYQGQFDPASGGELVSRLERGQLFGQMRDLIDDCCQIVANRTLDELHRIALNVEWVIANTAHKQAHAMPKSPLDNLIDVIAPNARTRPSRKSLPERAMEIRRDHGDTKLWLHAGAENATLGGKDVPSLPNNVRRAEYFSVIALWKAAALKQVVAFTMRSLMRAGIEQQSVSINDSLQSASKSLQKILKQTPSISAAIGMLEIAHLGAEVARAATLATEASYLDERIRLASMQVAKDVESELREVSNHRLREAGSKGAAARMQKFKAPKARAIELYKAGRYRSRDAAVEDIFQTLQKEKFAPIAVSTIRKYFVDYDKQITQRREKSQKKS